MTTDHPRSRGVYFLTIISSAPDAGSSPLARGLLDKNCGAISVTRIIPARAGFTGQEAAGGVDEGDHPRSRGVYTSIAAYG